MWLARLWFSYYMKKSWDKEPKHFCRERASVSTVNKVAILSPWTILLSSLAEDSQVTRLFFPPLKRKFPHLLISFSDWKCPNFSPLPYATNKMEEDRKGELERKKLLLEDSWVSTFVWCPIWHCLIFLFSALLPAKNKKQKTSSHWENLVCSGVNHDTR